jgi:protoporphyrinogen oxidase
MWNELEYGGSYFGDVPAGGYRRLVDAMVSDVDVRLGRSVTEIEASRDGVRVRTADGSAEEGSHVVVTVPLGVLKRGPATVFPGAAAGSAGGH